MERLGNEERRLRTLACKEKLRKGSDENDRHLDDLQNVADSIEAGAVVGQPDVGEDKPWLLFADRFDSTEVSARNGRHLMAEAADKIRQIERNEGLVLDDQHLRAQLLGHFPAGLV